MALDYYLKAQQSSPFHIQVLNDLGTCYDNLGRKQEAENAYRKALALNPRFTDAIFNLAAVQFNNNEFEEAYKTIQKIPAGHKSERKKYFLTVILSALADSSKGSH
jgi:Flp pilus assembly protein TadD